MKRLRKCRLRGHRWIEHKEFGYRWPSESYRGVADEANRTTLFCTCCERTNRKSATYEWLGTIHSLEMYKHQWDTLRKDRFLVRR